MTTGLSRKQLMQATDCPPYLIRYYCDCGYLPILRHSIGPGNPVLYHPDAIQIVQKRMNRRRGLDANTAQAGTSPKNHAT